MLNLVFEIILNWQLIPQDSISFFLMFAHHVFLPSLSCLGLVCNCQMILGIFSMETKSEILYSRNSFDLGCLNVFLPKKWSLFFYQTSAKHFSFCLFWRQLCYFPFSVTLLMVLHKQLHQENSLWDMNKEIMLATHGC